MTGPISTSGKLLLWAAQGFGVGRVPIGPGTFGSVLGLVWFALLLLSGRVWVLVFGTLALIGVAIWLCGVAERILGENDPGSVVLDEIAAIPACFGYWLYVYTQDCGSLPDLKGLLSHWPLVLGLFAAFRVFDVLKPWPVRQSQSLRGGWGIVIDDLLAAGYVNLVVLAVHALHWI